MQLISEKTLQNIEESLGLNFLDEDKKNDIMKEIVGLIGSRAGMRIVRELSDDEKDAFNRIPDDEPEEMEEYLMSKNPDAKDIFEEEAQRMKDEFLNTRLK